MVGARTVEAWAASGAGGRGGFAPPLGALAMVGAWGGFGWPLMPWSERKPELDASEEGKATFGASDMPAIWNVP
eukprot:8523548-Pyramimonas_sp.AAC.2